MDPQQTPTPETDNTTRLPFDVEFYKQAGEFCDVAINAIPELAGIAVIPIWSNQPENTPAGMLKLRKQQPPYLDGLLALLKRMAAFNLDVHQDFIRQLQMFDQYAAELATRIKDRVDQLNALTPQPDEQNTSDGTPE